MSPNNGERNVLILLHQNSKTERHLNKVKLKTWEILKFRRWDFDAKSVISMTVATDQGSIHDTFTPLKNILVFCNF